MGTLRANVAQLYTPIYDKFMLATYSEETQIRTQIFDEIIDTTKEWKYDELTGLGMWVSASEGSGGGYTDPVLGYPKTITPSKVWQKFKVSFESVDQDEYALIKKVGQAESMGRGGRAKIEKDCANFLTNGFTTASAPDGQYLWDTDHPKNREETGTTYDNLLTGAFSHDNLEAAETQITNNFIGPDGLPIECIDDPILLYPPALKGAVKRVLDDRALERPGTTERDINRFAGRYKPVEWRWLASQFGGSDTAWFIIFKELGMLKVVMNSKPHFTSWVDEDLEYYNFKGRFLYDYGATNWLCGFGSTGV